jgi:hypothetical protein
MPITVNLRGRTLRPNGAFHELENGSWEVSEVPNDPIGTQLGHRRLRIAVVDRDHRNVCRFPHGDVANGVSYHDRPTRRSAGLPDRTSQQLGIRLLQPKRVSAANCNEPVRQPQRIKKAPRQPFKLVGAHRQAATALRKLIERSFEPGKRPRTVGNVGGIMLDEVSHQLVYFCRGEAAPLGSETALDHLSCSASNHVAGFDICDRRQTDTRENDIERGDEIGRAIDQCAVEIEYDDGSNHDLRFASGRRERWQGFVRTSMAKGLGSIAQRRYRSLHLI